jgi:ankyrin repeat protein
MGDEGRTPLIYSAQKGHYAVVQVLLGYYNNSGSDINESDKSNLTALHHAAQNGHASVVQLLLEKGAQIVVDDNDEQEALRQAVYKKQYESTAARLIQLFTPKVTNIPCSNDR